MICAREPCGTVFCDDSDIPPGAATPRRYCSPGCAKRAKPSWGPGRARRRQEHPRWADGARDRRGEPQCARPGNRAYATEADAVQAAWDRAGQGLLLYPHGPCPGGCWHLGRQPKSNLTARREEPGCRT